MRDEREQVGALILAMLAALRELWWGRKRCPCEYRGEQEVEDGQRRDSQGGTG